MSKKTVLIGIIVSLLVFGSLSLGIWAAYGEWVKIKSEKELLYREVKTVQEESASISASLLAKIEELNNEDQRKTNNAVKKEIENLKMAYKKSLEVYTILLEIREQSSQTALLESQFATILDALAKDNLDLVATATTKLKTDLEKEKLRLSTTVKIPANVVAKNEAPSSGYSRQKVTVGESSYLVDIVAADLNSTKVIVDTASDSTCTKDCPVLPLATYVSRNGAIAGINGTYFCPETYPDCAEKKNTFDVLVMNKNKVYFNSDNNIYSSVPAAIFSGSTARYVRESSSWGRDTGVDAVIANRPILVLDGNVMVSTTDQGKENLRGSRGFLGSTNSTAYIGVVKGATVGEAALVLKEMGIKNAINLDSGGSTALWSGGYKAGPGRNIPNAVLFVRK